MVIRRTSPARQSGFALVDCIVATVLLGVALSVMIGLAASAISSQATGEKMATAAELADEQLQLMLARGPDSYAQRYPISGACDAPFNDYSYKLAITGGGSPGEPFAVSCTLSWTLSGTARSLTVDTLMAQRSSGEDSEPDPLRSPKTSVTRTP